MILPTSVAEEEVPAAKNFGKRAKRTSLVFTDEVDEQGMVLGDLDVLANLGAGTFGRVKLVQHKRSKRTYALKILLKAQVVAYKQQANVMSEKNVMLQAQHPFILKLVATMKDEHKLYMVLELCLGGELFMYLHCNPDRDEEYVDNTQARFYASCVLDAFDYLHAKNIVYRDLKPENLLIDRDGYIKVVDFGFAKVVTTRTYTLCGTPEYLAPELVLGKGHQKGVDYWALGVLIYEMIVGFSPFAAKLPDGRDPDQMHICRNIIRLRMSPYPDHCDGLDQAKDVIKRLLTKEPPKRLGVMRGGASAVKKHPWFAPTDWKALVAREVEAPWIPNIKDEVDTSNFDADDDEDPEEPYEDDGSHWDDGF